MPRSQNLYEELGNEKGSRREKKSDEKFSCLYTVTGLTDRDRRGPCVVWRVEGVLHFCNVAGVDGGITDDGRMKCQFCLMLSPFLAFIRPQVGLLFFAF
jgi:hypothetical protein